MAIGKPIAARVEASGGRQLGKADEKKLAKYSDLQLKREGKQIVVPEGMALRVAGDWLHRQADEEEREVALHAKINAYPLDGAVALMKALKVRFGWTSLRPTPGFFGDTPPTMVNVITDATGESVQVPWGQIAIPGVVGTLATGVTPEADENRLYFVLSGKVRQKDLAAVRDIIKLAEEIVREESIYKGKAIRVTFPESLDEYRTILDFAPRYLDLSGVRENELVLPRAVERLVDTTLFAPIEHTEACRRAQIPLKRGVLLEGTFGTGKTLTAHVTASKAIRNGWTFVYLEDVDRLAEALAFAREYAPAVVFAEDIDRADSEGERTDRFNNIMNAVDSVAMKGSEVMVVLTTNNVEKIHKGMMRPGRLDAIIPIRPPDQEAAGRLVQLYARGLLRAGEDLSEVARKLDGMIPAVVREVVERAKLAAVNRLADENADGELELRARDLELAADSMIEHLAFLRDRPVDSRSRLEKGMAIMGDEMAKAIDRAMGGSAGAHLIEHPAITKKANGKEAES